MKLREQAQDILNLYNYYTGAIITDANGTIVYYYGSMHDLNSLSPDEAIGCNVLEVYPNIKKEESSIYNVLKTGIPMLDVNQQLENKKGEVFNSVNSTFPIKNGDEIIGAVEIYYYRTSTEIQQGLNSIVPKGTFFNLYSVNDIISLSPSMEELKSKIVKASHTDSTVLIYGETGTGKELVAQAIHSGSQRRDKKFISQNCAAIPENLLESILFGTVKGSYTDAKDKPGLLEAANGGTLFLDEIHAMNWNVQAKLLKAIEEKSFYRVGGTEPIPVDIRVITAVNIDPAECVLQGKLRPDLYYRINVVRLNVPPLRDRKEDLDKLTQYYIDKFNEQMNMHITGLSDDVFSFFHNYNWPGNVRELRNVIECAFNFAQGEKITIEDIDSYADEIQAAKVHEKNDNITVSDLKTYMKNYEKELILLALSECKTLTEAAEKLGISKQSLNNKLNQLGLSKKAGAVQ
ncbi:MAG: sigma-54 interaction domain-containing protein [Anaerovoracaceae bacterium]